MHKFRNRALTGPFPKNPPGAAVIPYGDGRLCRPPEQEVTPMRKEHGFRRDRSTPKLEMAPMIDVVFLLLIFFVVSFRAPEPLVQHDVVRPQAGGGPRIQVLEISVYDGGLAVNGRRTDLGRLDAFLAHVGRYDSTQPVIVSCTGDSRHAGLVQVLDLCAKNNFSHVSITSR